MAEISSAEWIGQRLNGLRLTGKGQLARGEARSVAWPGVLVLTLAGELSQFIAS